MKLRKRKKKHTRYVPFIVNSRFNYKEEEVTNSPHFNEIGASQDPLPQLAL